jgi:hypothetical protein
LEQALFKEADDEYHIKLAEIVEEATKLIAVGYEQVSTMATSKSTENVNDMEKRCIY